jgi:hypothetical protein
MKTIKRIFADRVLVTKKWLLLTDSKRRAEMIEKHPGLKVLIVNTIKKTQEGWSITTKRASKAGGRNMYIRASEFVKYYDNGKSVQISEIKKD